MPRCQGCNDYHSGKCEPTRKRNHQTELEVARGKKELEHFEAEFDTYLRSLRGRFDLFYLRRESLRKTG